MVTDLEKLDLKLIPAKVVDFDVNQYRCCDKHRMFLLPEVSSDIDSFKVVINPEGIVGQTIKVNRSLFCLLYTSPSPRDR